MRPYQVSAPAPAGAAGTRAIAMRNGHAAPPARPGAGTLVPRLVLTGPRTIERTTGRVAAPTGTDVLVRVHTVGLCATDLALYLDAYRGPHASPLCFGHEWSGVVETVGEDVEHLRAGDKVTGECLLACGDCDYCARNPNLCEHVRKFGITVDGAARGALVLDERHLRRAAEDVDLGLLALAEPLSVAAQAIAQGTAGEDRPVRDLRVLVLGGGMIGLSCVAVLRLLHGCEHPVLSDPLPERMRYALDLGASAPIGELGPPPMEGDAAEYYAQYDLSPVDETGFDLVLDTTGSATAFQQGLSLLRPGGTLACVGFIESVEICPRKLTLKAARIVGSLGGTGKFDEAVGLVERNAKVLEPLVSHVFPFTDVDAAVKTALDRRSAMKVQLRMGDD
jgi:L-gulonate 5-dehydrogenase